jgi:protein TonB
MLLCAGHALAAPPERPFADLKEIVSRAKDIRVLRHSWDETTLAVRIEASARADDAWLERLVDVGLRESGRRAESSCAVACRSCPGQLHVDITFKSGRMSYFLSLFMREGLAFLRTNSAAAWSFADSLGPVLDLLREGLPKDALTQEWVATTVPPAPLDADSAAYRGNDVLVSGMPEALTRVAPSYPTRAREKGVSGVVQVQALLTASGLVDRVRVAESVPDLDEAALEAVRQWKFKPATCGGRPVPVWVMVPIRFTIH